MKKEVCTNWLNYEAIRRTVDEYNIKWGAEGEEIPCTLDEFQITKNCMECNMRPDLPSPLKTLTEMASLFKSPVMAQLEAMDMKYKCFG